jgi:hypothetical protein
MWLLRLMVLRQETYYSRTSITVPVVLAAGEILYAKQDTGTDVTMTAYGIEEALT